MVGRSARRAASWASRSISSNRRSATRPAEAILLGRTTRGLRIPPAHDVHGAVDLAQRLGRPTLARHGYTAELQDVVVELREHLADHAIAAAVEHASIEGVLGVQQCLRRIASSNSRSRSASRNSSSRAASSAFSEFRRRQIPRERRATGKARAGGPAVDPRHRQPAVLARALRAEPGQAYWPAEGPVSRRKARPCR